LSFVAYGRQPVGLARLATSFHLLAQMKGGKAKCLNASDPTELHGWKENAVDGEQLGSITGSSDQKTCGDESASTRRVRTMTQQPNLLAEALGSNRWC